MPFIKIKSGPSTGKYRSPTGKILTVDQVKAYYAKQAEGNSSKARNKRESFKKNRE